jgi:biopolymer transport protein ExbB/TolQ
MNVPVSFFAETQLPETQLHYVLSRATVEARVILVVLALFSVFAWYMMLFKGMQMRRAKKLNQYFDSEFRAQKSVLAIFERKLDVFGCPFFAVYQEGCQELNARLKSAAGSLRQPSLSLKSMEHIKRTVESAVARESIKLESGLILLASAVSGGPFLGLLGTVWGVMDTFANVGQKQIAELVTMAPGVSAALVTTVAGLVVAIPSMFGYNFLVHSLRVQTVELDNFAQELASKMEVEYLKEE